MSQSKTKGDFMSKFIFWSRACVIAGLLCFQASASAELPTVSFVDVSRYAGTWYEIARYPNSFQEGCVAVKAEYELKKNGRLGVVNSCRMGSLDGKLDVAKGRARIVDKTTNAKLKVSFAPFGLFGGDYWIIALDPNYQWAVVSEPKQEFLWILSRNVTLEEPLLDDIKAYLSSLNFDLSKLLMTKQPSSPY